MEIRTYIHNTKTEISESSKICFTLLKSHDNECFSVAADLQVVAADVRTFKLTPLSLASSPQG